MGNTVVIDCFPESVARWRDGYAVVAVDVVRATTTAGYGGRIGTSLFSSGQLGRGLRTRRQA
jgi:hypothetical protein